MKVKERAAISRRRGAGSLFPRTIDDAGHSYHLVKTEGQKALYLCHDKDLRGIKVVYKDNGDWAHKYFARKASDRSELVTWFKAKDFYDGI